MYLQNAYSRSDVAVCYAGIREGLVQAAESALALWVAMKDSVSQMYDNRGLAEFWGPDV